MGEGGSSTAKEIGEADILNTLEVITNYEQKDLTDLDLPGDVWRSCFEALALELRRNPVLKTPAVIEALNEMAGAARTEFMRKQGAYMMLRLNLEFRYAGSGGKPPRMNGP